ncbi:MAG: hypothetical protein P8Y42_16925 [Exilibacterium sp.]
MIDKSPMASVSASITIAVVAMMDSEGLWFKSRLGLDIPELDRKVAFCAHGVSQFWCLEAISVWTLAYA